VDSVAKLFASESKRGEDNDPIFKALNQVLNGYVHNKGSALLIPSRDTEHVTLLEYPVVVCSDFSTFYRADVEQKQELERIEDNFLLEVNYAFLNANKITCRDYFLIDVVQFSNLQTLFESLNHEIANVQLLVGD
jgi:hypothetical protein